MSSLRLVLRSAAVFSLLLLCHCADDAARADDADDAQATPIDAGRDAAAVDDTAPDAGTPDAAREAPDSAAVESDARVSLDAAARDATAALDAADASDGALHPSDAATDAADAAASTACRAGSTLSAVAMPSLYAEYGSVFSSTRYVRDDASSHKPAALVVQVMANGTPVPNCEVSWTAETGSGWLFATSQKTDASGKVRAFWTAGDKAAQTASAKIQVAGAADQRVQFSGSATPSARTRTDSVHVYYDIPARYTELQVRVTPVTGPESTYYSTMNWNGAYAGIQFDGATSKVLFSVWDVDASKKAEITDQGACNETVGFGGEGTGTSCRLVFPPASHGAIAGLPSDYKLKPGDAYETHLVISYPAACSSCADYTVYFTDVTRGLGPISLGTQRYKEKAMPSGASGFIEDWWDEPGDHCLNSLTRSVYFHDIQAKTAAGWQPITSASFSPNYLPSNHEICANYFFGVRDGKFLMSSGGSELVSRPVIDGDAVFGKDPKESL